MGKATDQALRDIEATKAALERDVHRLTDSVPDAVTDMATQAAGNLGPKVLGGAGAAVVAALGAKSARKRSGRRRVANEERRAARVQAEELARAFGSVGSTPQGGPLAPPPEPKESSGGGGRIGLVLVLAVAAGAAAAWFAGKR